MHLTHTLANALALTFLINQASHAVVVKDDTAWPPSQPATLKSSSILSVDKRPIFIFAFVHDDVPDSKIPSIYPDYFFPVIKDIKVATGRDVSVKIVRNTPPYTTYAYKGENQASYDGWKTLGMKYRDDNNLPIGRTTKFMLLTHDRMNGITLGLGGIGQQFSLASLTNKQTVGHEFGHMLDAQHELSETRYNGWWCETFMTPKANPLHSNCYVFTNPNRERIGNFLSGVP